MLKIIVAIDSLKPSESSILHAIDLAKSLDAHLVAVFLDDISNFSYKSYQILHSQLAISQEKYDICNKQDDLIRKESALHVEEMFRKENLNYTLHHDNNISLIELISESSYADLLIIDSKETVTFHDEDPPTHFIRELLKEIHCPVMVVSKEYTKINKILLLYNGDSYSTNAIKMFGYLFPIYREVKVEVLTIKPTKNDRQSLDTHLLKEYMKSHFPNTFYTELHGIPDVEIINHFKYRYEHELIVLGSYHRGTFSHLVRPSVIEAVMREIKSPLFIDNN